MRRQWPRKAEKFNYSDKKVCSWKALPHEFPPEGTVHDYFHTWRCRGVWEQIQDTLRRRVRRQAGRGGTAQRRHYRGAKLVLAKMQNRSPRLALLWADGGYAGKLVGWVQQVYRWLLQTRKCASGAWPQVSR